jgi:hypothetical protein
VGIPTLNELKARIAFLQAEADRGQIEIPELLTVNMIQGIVDTLSAVGFDDPVVRKEPFVGRITGSFRVINDPRVQALARDTLAVLYAHGLTVQGRRNPW